MKYFTYKSLYTIIPFVFLLFPLNGKCAAGALESESEQFYFNFISGIDYQTPQNQLSLMNYLLITDRVRPNLDKTNIINCLDHLAESGTSPTIRNHARLIRLALSTVESTQSPEPAIHFNNVNTENAILIFLKYLNENFFQCRSDYQNPISNNK